MVGRRPFVFSKSLEMLLLQQCQPEKGKKRNPDEGITCILESDESSKVHRKNWARLIQKIYEVETLTCPKCYGKMKVISVIEDQNVIKNISAFPGLLMKSKNTWKHIKGETGLNIAGIGHIFPINWGHPYGTLTTHRRTGRSLGRYRSRCFSTLPSHSSVVSEPAPLRFS